MLETGTKMVNVPHKGGAVMAIAGWFSLNTALAEVIDTTVAAGKTLCQTSGDPMDGEGYAYCTKNVCTDIHCGAKGCTIVAMPAEATVPPGASTGPSHAPIPSGPEKAPSRWSSPTSVVCPTCHLQQVVSRRSKTSVALPNCHAVSKTY